MRPLVTLARCPDYASAAGALPGLLAPLGGPGAFVRPGQSVLIKPNLLTDAEPARAVTTHPELVRALVRLFKGAGARVAVGDSPANVADLERVWDRTGFRAMCREEDVPLLNLEQGGSRETRAGGMSFPVARPVAEADVLVNVPKVKTHVLTTLTAAVKNLYGVLPGFRKTLLHRDHPRPEDFGRMLAALCAAVRPALSVADAVTGMEGDGPSAGTPAPLGFLAASADPAALDTVLCSILSIPPARVPYLRFLAEAGLGPGSPEAIELAGGAAADFRPPAFRLPRAVPVGLIPDWLIRVAQPLVWVRPRFSAACVACGRCVGACPAGALALAPGMRRPRLAPARCIACCCCHEVCPARAVRMTESPAMRAARLLRRLA